MNKILKSVALVAGAAMLTVAGAHAQDSGALIDALVKKGVLSSQEGEEIRVDLTKEYNTTSAGKLEISSFINHLKLFGDARLRYQWQNQQTYATSASNGLVAGINNNDSDRYRYRVRLGAVYTYDPHWSAVVRLETGLQNNGTNADFGAFWDKAGAAISVGQLYLNYTNKFSLFDGTSTVPNGKSFNTVTTPGLEIGVNAILGRGPSQLLLSDAWWAGDLNPEGLAEEFTFNNVGVDGLSFALRGAEYITSNEANNGDTAAAPYTLNDGAMFAAQFETKYAWTKKNNVRVAPMYIQETSGTFLNQDANSTAENIAAPSSQLISQNAYLGQGNLSVIAVPTEVNFVAFNIPQQVWGTYGANLDADKRRGELGLVSGTTVIGGENTFWNAGYKIGQNKVKGDWSTQAEYRYVEAAAWDSNLQDPDFGIARGNQEGVVLRATYNFTDFLVGRVSWNHSTPIDSSRTSGRPGNPVSALAANGTDGLNTGTVDVLQADINWSF